MNGLSRLSISEIEHQGPSSRRANACMDFVLTATCSLLIFLSIMHTADGKCACIYDKINVEASLQ